MRKQIISIIFGILFSLNLAFALEIYSGENITIPLDFEIVNCSVINSINNLEGLNLSWYEKNIIISTLPNYQSDTLTISCWVIMYGEVVEYVYSGGGSSCKYNKNFNWNCSEWDSCLNNIQNRTCKKYNNCGNTYGKPNETQSCIVDSKTNFNKTKITEVNQQESVKDKFNWILIIIEVGLVFFIILLVILLILLKKLRERVNKNSFK